MLAHSNDPITNNFRFIKSSSLTRLQARKEPLSIPAVQTSQNLGRKADTLQFVDLCRHGCGGLAVRQYTAEQAHNDRCQSPDNPGLRCWPHSASRANDCVSVYADCSG